MKQKFLPLVLVLELHWIQEPLLDFQWFCYLLLETLVTFLQHVARFEALKKKNY